MCAYIRGANFEELEYRIHDEYKSKRPLQLPGKPARSLARTLSCSLAFFVSRARSLPHLRQNHETVAVASRALGLRVVCILGLVEEHKLRLKGLEYVNGICNMQFVILNAI